MSPSSQSDTEHVMTPAQERDNRLRPPYSSSERYLSPPFGRTQALMACQEFTMRDKDCRNPSRRSLEGR
ncbi:hypothetical protein B0H67DRAFT_585575 [Lasiosphaeris hirsuta]|uniref:Uncharacterized protein n=1 Tax=Lasiosphaeris hirsuta TaxID=260670 RepID=A0AA40DSB9_9PEZI|nr:hypothetical protein B0H67DRAFT_585575 [Lasiosphaeris hirsuta]